VRTNGGIPASFGRTSQNFRRLAATVRSWRLPCALCGQPIKYDALDPNDPLAFTVDHKLSRELYPQLAEELGNLQPAHKKCNSAKHTGPAKPGLGSTSASW